MFKICNLIQANYMIKKFNKFSNKNLENRNKLNLNNFFIKQ